MIKKPELLAHETSYKRIFLLDKLPAPLTRVDEHWQIFDDYTAWPEFRTRQIRVPQSREWFRAKEEIAISKIAAGYREEISRIFLPGETDLHAVHPDKEIRKNRYFYIEDDREIFVDVFLGSLWGLILAQADLASEDEAAAFTVPEFSLSDVSDSEFFRGENLVHRNFAEVRAEVNRE